MLACNLDESGCVGVFFEQRWAQRNPTMHYRFARAEFEAELRGVVIVASSPVSSALASRVIAASLDPFALQV